VADGAALPDVKVGGPSSFRHLEDPDTGWQQVKADRNADGSTSSVWERWLAFSPDPPIERPARLSDRYGRWRSTVTSRSTADGAGLAPG
jgi:hypothetical protein